MNLSPQERSNVKHLHVQLESFPLPFNWIVHLLKDMKQLDRIDLTAHIGTDLTREQLMPYSKMPLTIMRVGEFLSDFQKAFRKCLLEEGMKRIQVLSRSLYRSAKRLKIENDDS